MNSNIILIGMPASGKSTAGVILAKVLGKKFVDTDLYIQDRENKLLRDIIKEKGLSGFLSIEEDVLSSLDETNAVIATGGSAVYSVEGMNHLKRIGKVVYLKVGKEELFKRLKNIRERGVVLRDGETLEEMYDERCRLYEMYADVVVKEDGSSIEETVERIADELNAS
ncbi:shikimate kinase [Lachnospiraceae bacterium G41]|nr:shikimate kinase [Lachnospiraceae bacterium G41]